MKKEMTSNEKVLTLALAILLVFVVYFVYFLTPLNNKINQYDSDTQSETLMVEQYESQVKEVQTMNAELSRLEEEGISRNIPAFDNNTAVIAELNGILADAEDYSLVFDTITYNDYLAERPISLSFRTGTYQEARDIINRLQNSENVNQISDLSMVIDSDYSYEEYVQVYLIITYFEVVS